MDAPSDVFHLGSEVCQYFDIITWIGLNITIEITITIRDMFGDHIHPKSWPNMKNNLCRVENNRQGGRASVSSQKWNHCFHLNCTFLSVLLDDDDEFEPYLLPWPNGWIICLSCSHELRSFHRDCAVRQSNCLATWKGNIF